MLDGLTRSDNLINIGRGPAAYFCVTKGNSTMRDF